MRPIFEELPAIKEEIRELKISFNEMSKSISEMTAKNISSENEGSKDELDVSRIKELNEKHWASSLNERKHLFFSALRNEEKAAIFEDFLSREPPFIPRSCREKDIKGWQNSKEWQKLKQSREEENMKHNIAKMKTFADAQKKKIEDIDTTFMDRFSHLSANVLEHLKTMWAKDTATEEEVSRSIWQGKKKFLLSLPDKKEEVDPETDHEDNYQNNHGIRMNFPKNSSKNRENYKNNAPHVSKKEEATSTSGKKRDTNFRPFKYGNASSNNQSWRNNRQSEKKQDFRYKNRKRLITS